MNKPLDKNYHDKKLRLVLRDLSDMPADEYARALIRLANVADDSVICEPEFAKLRAEMERRVPDASELQRVIYSADYNAKRMLEADSFWWSEIATIRVEFERFMRAMLAAAPSAPKADDPVKVLPHWEPCNPGCHPELNGYRDWHCHCEAAQRAIAAARKGEGE